MYQTLVAKACKAQESKKGKVDSMQVFFRPKWSIKGPMHNEPKGSAIATMLAKITSCLVIFYNFWQFWPIQEAWTLSTTISLPDSLSCGSKTALKDMLIPGWMTKVLAIQQAAILF